MGLVIFTKEVEYHQKMVVFMVKHGFFTIAKASSCLIDQVEYHKLMMVFMVDNQPRIMDGWMDGETTKNLSLDIILILCLIQIQLPSLKKEFFC
jgi:hypothetical protein